MPSLPLIGITTYGRNEKNEFILHVKYVESVRRACGIPILIPTGEMRIAALLDRIDGIILSGGGDIKPDFYGGKSHETIYNVDLERDETEIRITKEIIKRTIPILAICRGMQVINTVLGGTLHAHLPDIYGENISHRLPSREPIEHIVTVNDATKLFSILKESDMRVASSHHQSIQKLADGLIITAESEDGVIEAIEKEDHPWLIGVQWHPELTAKSDPLQQKLFDHLVQTAMR
ncbi:gamma-glutamyl-gamma-aminobutyrate hydrolase family protein [bacterium]|nr:gamma-glutamyl-gamma-aminobutyrate hydrolase family protein [bacterium]